MTHFWPHAVFAIIVVCSRRLYDIFQLRLNIDVAKNGCHILAQFSLVHSHTG